MNATPTSLNPVNAIQTQSSAGKQEAASAEAPFSQVLSSEMAQKRADSDAGGKDDAKSGSAAVPQPTDKAGNHSTAASQLTESDAPATDPLQVDATLAMPDALLALALPVDLQKLSPASMGDVSVEPMEPALDDGTQTTLEGRKGRAPQLLQATPLAAETPDSRQNESAQPDKARFQPGAGIAAAAATASPASANGLNPAAAFSAQLAAAKQSEALKTSELPPGIMNSPVMRAAIQAPLEATAVLEGPAASRLAPSVGTQAWNQALGEKIVWMATGAQQTASLTLNPPNLGPLQVVLNISNDQATASFFSAQPEVRQALESAFPKLREMMNEAGIELGQATVSADTPRQNDTPDGRTHRLDAPFMAGADDASAIDLHAAAVPVIRSGRGLVDTFA